mmetsp:Transcript_2482/g.2598  ORF Transcript_2482/g.2598 Transcript_2482/m.2598 type:complete len:241 (-) Transcript_2482:149-871(-)
MEEIFSHNTLMGPKENLHPEVVDSDMDEKFLTSLIKTPAEISSVGTDPDEPYDLYLMEKIYPVLIPGLEELSREVEKYLGDEKKLDPLVRKRFNPCTFLAQFLMRNNPNGGNNQRIASKYFEHARIERNKRFWEARRQQMYRKFMTLPKYELFQKIDVPKFVKLIDDEFFLQGKLLQIFPHKKVFGKQKDDDYIKFDAFYTKFSAWFLEQEEFEGREFIQGFKERKKQNELEDFKKKMEK